MAFQKLLNIKNVLASMPSAREVFHKAIRMGQLEAQMLDLNHHQMFDLGVDALGAPLGEYSLFTKAIKERKGQRFYHVTLKDTEEFYDSMKIKFEYTVTISGDMQKPDTDLSTIYPHALGLTNESKNEVIDEIKENFLALLLKGIGR